MGDKTERQTVTIPGAKRLLFLCLFCLMIISMACFWMPPGDRFYSKRSNSFQEPRNGYRLNVPKPLLNDANTTTRQADKMLNFSTSTSNTLKADVLVNLSSPTSAKHSRLTVRSVSGYTLCSTLEITIEARNSQNEVKSYGGDYFWIWIHSPDFNASATADEMVDHQNGTYTARFKLHWAGRVYIGASLVLSSEAVATLTRVRDMYPARCSYQGRFKKGPITVTATCHFTTNIPLPPSEQSIKTFCNFTDKATGFPWYCVKPEILPCDAFVAQAVKPGCGGPLAAELSQQERKLSLRPQAVPSATQYIQVDVAGQNPENLSLCLPRELPGMPSCSEGLQPRPLHSTTGYYYKDEWHSLVCRKQQFDVSAMRKCLQNRKLHFLGDSTVRQWYEYFVRDVIKNTVVEKKDVNIKCGPHVAVDKQFNISLFYRMHGYPIISGSWRQVEDILYVPNLIDTVTNDSNEVILLTLWAHFTASSLEYYRQRWYQIRAAIIRLKLRNPGARIFIKSANTREPTDMDKHSWYGNQLDITMREIMTGVDGVTIIDVWDMTIGHRTGYFIHPSREIISQEIEMLLSFLCPDDVLGK